MIYLAIRQASFSRFLPEDESLGAAARLLRSVPKVELHGHLSGCLRLATIAELAPAAGLALAKSDERNLATSVVLRRPARNYRRSFRPWKLVIDKVTSRPENHRRLAYEVAEDMASDGVVYAEMRTSVRLPFDLGAFETMLEGIDIAAEEAAYDHGIDVRFVLGFNRRQFSRLSQQDQVKIAAQVIDATEKFRHRVVGFDLWGNEIRRPPRVFAEAFKLIRGAGFPLAIHAGEAGSVAYVRQAIDILQCRRIGHGTSILKDANLLDHVREKEIGVEVCLTSNRLTGVVRDVASHPVLEMLHRGLRISLCSDNTLVYDTSLSREYALAVYAGLISPAQLLHIAESAATLTFLPADDRARLSKRLRLQDDTKAGLIEALNQHHRPRHEHSERGTNPVRLRRKMGQ